MVSDPLAVAREALQAIRDRHYLRVPKPFDEDSCGHCRHEWPCPDVRSARCGLDALEAAEAAQAERDEKIRQHLRAVMADVGSYTDAYDELASALGLLAAKTTTEPHERYGSTAECVCGRQWPCSGGATTEPEAS